MWKTKTTAQSTSDFSPQYQTSQISHKTSDLMLKYQNWQHCSCQRHLETRAANVFGLLVFAEFFTGNSHH